MHDSWFTFGPDVLANIIGGLAAGLVVGVVIWIAQATAARGQLKRSTRFLWDQMKADLVVSMGLSESVGLTITECSSRTVRVVKLAESKPISQWADLLKTADIRAFSDLLQAIARLKIAADSVNSRVAPAVQANKTQWLYAAGRSDALELWVAAVINSVPRVEMDGFFPSITTKAEESLKAAYLVVVASSNADASIHSYQVEQNRVKLAYEAFMLTMAGWFQTDVHHP